VCISWIAIVIESPNTPFPGFREHGGAGRIGARRIDPMPLSHQAEVQLRARVDRRFIDELYRLANAMHDCQDDTLSWVGDQIGKIADRAAFLGATCPEDYDDRQEAMLAEVYRRDRRQNA
jgi:hypothetical protein